MYFGLLFFTHLKRILKTDSNHFGSHVDIPCDFGFHFSHLKETDHFKVWRQVFTLGKCAVDVTCLCWWPYFGPLFFKEEVLSYWVFNVFPPIVSWVSLSTMCDRQYVVIVITCWYNTGHPCVAGDICPKSVFMLGLYAIYLFWTYTIIIIVMKIYWLMW